MQQLKRTMQRLCACIFFSLAYMQQQKSNMI